MLRRTTRPNVLSGITEEYIGVIGDDAWGIRVNSPLPQATKHQIDYAPIRITEVMTTRYLGKNMNLVRFTAYYLELCTQANDISDGYRDAIDDVPQLCATAIKRCRDFHSKPLGRSEKVPTTGQRCSVVCGVKRKFNFMYFVRCSQKEFVNKPEWCYLEVSDMICRVYGFEFAVECYNKELAKHHYYHRKVLHLMRESDKAIASSMVDLDGN
ncbi:hypothetical protein EDB82DRAFT_472299 [Fusarium venenatum]|uniref:uncharacterized protein n=1 Tax=Fusarium venenatum TaxID=56646 RepID=UPI001D9CECB7|nr:hypothetical protein EDB82DRAFT_472299 [Fusarium venenatum]